MTLLFVKDNVCYVDSRIVVGESAGLSSKITERNGVVYASAGMAEAADLAMFELSKKGWYAEVESVTEDPNHTFVVARIEGEILILDLSLAKPRFGPIVKPSSTGLQVMAGSGWRWFQAYFMEHGDVQKAFELTCQYCRDVAGPLESF